MPSTDPGRARANRALGAAIGASGAWSAGYGATWSGHAQSIVLVTAVALVAGAGLGALTWGLFDNTRGDGEGPTDAPQSTAWWFTALFGSAVGMLAGAFAGFPLGSLFGAGGGAVGGLVADATWRVSAPPRTGLDVTARGALAALTGVAAGFGTALWMAS